MGRPVKKPKAIITDFLNRVLFGHDPCSQVTLHEGSSRTDPLLTRMVKPSDFKPERRVEEFVEELLDFMSDGNGVDDDEVYCLKATWEDGEKTVVSRPIKIAGGAVNHAQLLGQAYRHIEVVARLNAGMVDSVTKNAGVQFYHARQMIEESADSRIRMIEAEQQLADRTHERQLEAKREERDSEFKSEIMKGLLALAPMFAGKLAGILPAGSQAVKASPQYQALKAIISEIPEDQWPNMFAWLQAAPLPIAQKGALSTIVESIIGDMQKVENPEPTNGKVTH